jgi:hypothetical protein
MGANFRTKTGKTLTTMPTKTPKPKPVKAKKKNYYTWNNPPRKAVITTPHREGCKEQFSGIISLVYWGDWRGNQLSKLQKGHLWISTPCNGVGCPGMKAVHSSVLINTPITPEKKGGRK